MIVEAAAAVALITPYLQKYAEGAVEALGEETTKGALKVLDWLREKLTGSAKEALEDLEKDPTDEDNQVVLRKLLGKYLEANPNALEELKVTLPATASAGDNSMVMNNSGDNAKLIQQRGTGNQASIS